MDQPSSIPQGPGFNEHHQEQVAEIYSDFNRHVTREKLGHEPTDSELAMNYVCTGGAKRLAQKNGRDTEGADL
jgi:hypothetical protein